MAFYDSLDFLQFFAICITILQKHLQILDQNGLNVHTNLYSSPELSLNSHFYSFVKNMQNSKKL